ncbi:hypothetical protein LEP1GSC041_0499 [Leptospira noguchii str. 2006001870]|uniref:Uncharacterized protein n=1 Tax=Leptospira noguchii serovar Autumnalis str. ZUN142 TaxID=1085540 RepID=M6U3N8_9LEPT|nr:hypothetical protein LEP1GSC041_0499 [Leptospira noguchii str. 2006001870]EMO39100.1 hypothetical protein LEP1GSC186_0282 [Leptospira noguchii serovar Autumnalis str. ZUN142]
MQRKKILANKKLNANSVALTKASSLSIMTLSTIEEDFRIKIELSKTLFAKEF